MLQKVKNIKLFMPLLNFFMSLMKYNKNARLWLHNFNMKGWNNVWIETVKQKIAAQMTAIYQNTLLMTAVCPHEALFLTHQLSNNSKLWSQWKGSLILSCKPDKSINLFLSLNSKTFQHFIPFFLTSDINEHRNF